MWAFKIFIVNFLSKQGKLSLKYCIKSGMNKYFSYLVYQNKQKVSSSICISI